MSEIICKAAKCTKHIENQHCPQTMKDWNTCETCKKHFCLDHLCNYLCEYRTCDPCIDSSTYKAFQEQYVNKLLAAARFAIKEPEICSRCEGSGAVYADGKAHLATENVPTSPCGDCEGCGLLISSDAIEGLKEALAHFPD